MKIFLTANSQQPTANSQQPTANSQQPTANSQQPTAILIRAHLGVYWWIFIWEFTKEISLWLRDFADGNYRFSAMETYYYKDETTLVWEYKDRLFVKILHYIISPAFKNIISPLCFSQKEPSGVKPALDYVRTALKNEEYNYYIRADVKAYYASIDRNILVKQIKEHFDDPRVIKYLEDIATIPIRNNGKVTIPNKGIARRSSLSPFFGSLYLDALDKAFTDIPGVCYARFVDDVIILTKTKRQYLKAKRRLQKILAALKLKLSRPKTKMGKLEGEFHFLGCSFAVSRNLQNKTHIVAATLYSRSCCRALTKINLMREGAVKYNPADAQRYLSKWAMWWTNSASLSYTDCLIEWIQYSLPYSRQVAKLGSGLLFTHTGVTPQALVACGIRVV